MRAIFRGGVLHGEEIEVLAARRIVLANIPSPPDRHYADFWIDPPIVEGRPHVDEYELDSDLDADGRLVYRWTRMV